MHNSTPLISTIVGCLFFAFVFGILAQKIRISPLVGYLLAGVLVGPYTPGFIADINLSKELAELGVILLMFGIGLHFSIDDLIAVKTIAIPGAIAQICAATLLGMLLSYIIGWSVITGVVLGLSLSTASTVVLLRALEERQLINTRDGQIAIGWLIVEDLVMVLILVLLPAIATVTEQGGAEMSALAGDLLLTTGKVVFFIIFMGFIGRHAAPWIIRYSDDTGSRELFTLSVLSLAIGIAFAAVKLFDVSFALGAFITGMVLNTSTLCHQAAKEILPLKDAFAVLFFVSVGMLFNPFIIIEQPLSVIGILIIIVIGKSLAAFLLITAMGHSRLTALTVSVGLSQIGEFSFILSGLGVVLELLPLEGRDIILAGSILSITINPFLFFALGRFYSYASAPRKT